MQACVVYTRLGNRNLTIIISFFAPKKQNFRLNPDKKMTNINQLNVFTIITLFKLKRKYV